MLDVFANNPGFSVMELSLALIRQPFIPYQIGSLGIFREIRLSTTQTFIEVRGSRLGLVPEAPRGAPPIVEIQDRRTGVAFGIPHFPIRKTIYADSVQNLRAFGSTDALESVYAVVDEAERELSQRLDLTLEFLRLGAVKGIITTAVSRVNGTPEIQLNLFDQFHVPQNAVQEWEIAGAGAIGQEAGAWAGQLTRYTNGLARQMAEELGGGTFRHIHIICGSEFFDEFTSHPEVRAAYIGITNNPIFSPNLGTQFSFKDVTIQEYRGSIGGVPLVEPDMGYGFPVGVPDMFVEIYAPGDYMEAVNTLALPRYSKMQEIDFDKGVELEAQMNVLPLCTYPTALFQIRVVPYVP